MKIHHKIKLALSLFGLITAQMFMNPAAAGAASGKPIVIKIATLAPSGSPYHEIMKDMAAGWRQESNGRVELKIYPDGVAGGEVDILRKMRIGQLDAGVLSLSGLSRAFPEIIVLGIPVIYRTRDDLLQVQDALALKIEKRMQQKGFVVLSWAIAGWVRFFVPEIQPSIDGLKKTRMHVFAGDDKTLELWKTVGVNAIPLSGTDVLTGLQSGMINAFFTTPVMAYASQWFAFTPCMIEMPWAPMMGAMVLSERAWQKVPENLHPKLKSIAEDTAFRLDIAMQHLERQAISEMKKRGLAIVKPDAQQLKQWQSLMKTALPEFKTKNRIPDEWFEIALSITRKK